MRNRRDAIKAALVGKLGSDALLVLMAMITRFPHSVADAQMMAADFNHAEIARDIGLSFGEYIKATKELEREHLVRRRRLPGRGRVTVIAFDELEKLAEAKA